MTDQQQKQPRYGIYGRTTLGAYFAMKWPYDIREQVNGPMVCASLDEARRQVKRLQDLNLYHGNDSRFAILLNPEQRWYDVGEPVPVVPEGSFEPGDLTVVMAATGRSPGFSFSELEDIEHCVLARMDSLMPRCAAKYKPLLEKVQGLMQACRGSEG